MNLIDVFIILFLAFSAFGGLGKSFVLEWFDLGSFALALLFSLRFYGWASNLIQINFKLVHSLSNLVGFFLVWTLTEIIFTFLINLGLRGNIAHTFVDRKLKFLSVLPSFLKGLLIVSVLLVLLGSFPIQPQIKQQVQSSKLGSIVLRKAQGLEGPLEGVFGGVTQDTLTFLTVEPKEGESINLGFKISNFTPRPDLENTMIGMVNQERVSRGISALTFDPSLRDIARAHSADMFERGYFSHYSPEGKNVADRANAAGISYQVIGENLAYAPTLELAHNGLMNSPGHRANILDKDFNKVGIGIEDGGIYELMITQEFTN